MITISELRKKLRREALEHTWRELSSVYHVNPGTLYKIAKDRSYNPANPKIRALLDLRPIPCRLCGYKPETRAVLIAANPDRVYIPPKWNSLIDLRPATLKYMLENRETMEDIK